MSFLDSPEYKKIALKALHQLVLMHITYLLKKVFLCLVKLRTKKQNALKCVYLLMKMGLIELIYLQFEKLITKFQKQPCHSKQ